MTRPAFDLQLDPDSPLPMGTQIRNGIVRLIRAGALPRGTRLPTVRQLASRTGVNRNTVQRIYRELTGQGLLETHVGDGTYVATAERPESAEFRPRMQAAIREVIESATRLGFGPEEIEATVQVELARIRRTRSAAGADLVRSRTRFAHWSKYSDDPDPGRRG